MAAVWDKGCGVGWFSICKRRWGRGPSEGGRGGVPRSMGSHIVAVCELCVTAQMSLGNAAPASHPSASFQGFFPAAWTQGWVKGGPSSQPASISVSPPPPRPWL